MKEKKARILLVDDDYDFLLQTKNLLEKENFEVVAAESRKKAEACMASEKPDLAVIDLMMDEMDDGFVLAKHLKGMAPDMPVIMVTSVESETGLHFERVVESEKTWIKADTVLTKPVRSEQLLKEIKRFIGEKND